MIEPLMVRLDVLIDTHVPVSITYHVTGVRRQDHIDHVAFNERVHLFFSRWIHQRTSNDLRSPSFGWVFVGNTKLLIQFRSLIQLTEHRVKLLLEFVDGIVQRTKQIDGVVTSRFSGGTGHGRSHG